MSKNLFLMLDVVNKTRQSIFYHDFYSAIVYDRFGFKIAGGFSDQDIQPDGPTLIYSLGCSEENSEKLCNQ